MQERVFAGGSRGTYINVYVAPIVIVCYPIAYLRMFLVKPDWIRNDSTMPVPSRMTDNLPRCGVSLAQVPLACSQ